MGCTYGIGMLAIPAAAEHVCSGSVMAVIVYLGHSVHSVHSELVMVATGPYGQSGPVT